MSVFYLIDKIQNGEIKNALNPFRPDVGNSSFDPSLARLKKYDRKIKKRIGKIQDSINKGQRQA